MKRTAGLILALVSMVSAARALEPRTWVIMDGRTVEATLVKTQGNAVIILDSNSRQIQLDKSWLSIGDNDYIKEFAPEVKAGFSATQAVTLPTPAKAAKVDPKTFVKKGKLMLPTESFEVLETPHFKVMSRKSGALAQDIGELAERMWVDAAFFHSTFMQKFRSEKMGIFIADEETTYEAIGAWYADLLEKSGRPEDANRTRATWPKSSSGNMTLPVENARENGIMQHARVFRGYRKSGDGKRTEDIKGVWVPFHVHCLASDMISVQAGGVSGFGSKGWFALTTGHSYGKEIGLTGKTETNLVSAQSASGRDATTSGGFKDSRNWATELKKLIRKGDYKPTLELIYGMDSNSADEKGIALTYGFSRYLESTLPRLSNFNKLVQRVSTSNQMPDPDSLAKIYGFADAAALEADILKYLTSTDFR